MGNYTKRTLEKLEHVYKELDYTVRYEKGNFQSGYCLVEHQKVVVVNKFFEVDGRVQVLLDLLSTIGFNPEQFSEEGKKYWASLRPLFKAEAVGED
ncbi:MAG: hypothetical protein KDC28_05425 [Saprospiraceae bacterium]|nr:hypothetical protein [Saprospiraceae bacterium]MCB9320857.1 hypothetical protein [Lewinellaceae bacterium]